VQAQRQPDLCTRNLHRARISGRILHHPHPATPPAAPVLPRPLHCVFSSPLITERINIMETVTTITGNGQPNTRNLPKIQILSREINDAALAHITENTGLVFEKNAWSYDAQPTTSNQITALFLTYNFKTQYNDNASIHNTLLLKFDHHIGFKVDSICLDCCEHNHIVTNGLTREDRLAC